MGEKVKKNSLNLYAVAESKSMRNTLLVRI